MNGAPVLRLRPLWLAVGWALMVAVVVLSLLPQPPPTLPGWDWDKANHATAYAVQMFWFAQLYPCGRGRLAWAVALAGLGLGLEVLQGLGGARQYDLHDMLANLIGVALGWVVATTPAGRLLERVEDGLAHLTGAR